MVACVLPLADICRIWIRDSIEEGRLRDVSSLPSILRQSILDMILMHRTINNPNCLATLSSVDFLRGLTSFNTQRGKIDDDRYLKLVRKSMRSIDSNGTMIGSSIKELRLNFYCIKNGNGSPIKETNFRNIIQLIKKCMNLKVLHLGMRETGSEAARDTGIDDDDDLGSEEEEESESLTIFQKSAFGGLLNNCIAMEPCLSVMENLDELSLDGFPYCAPFLVDHYPIIKFKNLRKLRLRDGDVDMVAWRHFLKSIRNTLISLEVKWFKVLPSVYEHPTNILPVSLPHLKSLTINTLIAKPFLDNLADCKALTYFCLYLDTREEEADLLALNGMDIFQLDVSVFIELKGGRRSNANKVFDNESRLKLVDIFKEKVKKFVLHVLDEDILFAPALEHVVDVCPDLVKFHLYIDTEEKGLLPQESERINSALVRLFSDKERASKIHDLKLAVDVDVEVLTSIFQNCVNVQMLDMQCCTRLFDEHFIDWALRGARPSHIDIYDCPNVSDAGLIAILVSSGRRLKVIMISTSYGEEILMNVGERTWRVLADHCRNVDLISGMPEMFDYLVKEKSFNKIVLMDR